MRKTNRICPFAKTERNQQLIEAYRTHGARPVAAMFGVSYQRVLQIVRHAGEPVHAPHFPIKRAS